jgi:hypothetical protein
MASSVYSLFFLCFFCHTDTPIPRYADRCSRLLAIAITSNQIPEFVIGLADPIDAEIGKFAKIHVVLKTRDKIKGVDDILLLEVTNHVD